MRRLKARQLEVGRCLQRTRRLWRPYRPRGRRSPQKRALSCWNRLAEPLRQRGHDRERHDQEPPYGRKRHGQEPPYGQERHDQEQPYGQARRPLHDQQRPPEPPPHRPHGPGGGARR
ncbi:hypothetical protein [Nonomuraea rhizosphaerae]|uniref:hypothetical protein n=1 Tax=Nonomuraea rhizosphaerae TaxID=2665663 RepID=UPI001FED1606|nr:hypothetical protein [Nonomuraea rhizosphaerae]